MKEELIIIKGIQVFNAAQDKNCLFLASFLPDGSPEKVKVKERPAADSITGGRVNIVFINDILEKVLNERFKERVIKKYLVSQLPQKKNKPIDELRKLKFYESLILLTYAYQRMNKELPNWRRILKATDTTIIYKEGFISTIKSEFKSILSSEELNKVIDSFNKLNKGTLM